MPQPEPIPPPASPIPAVLHDPSRRAELRRAEIARFVRARYGLRGTLALHRDALGWDLLRAPVNVTLAPLFLALRLIAAILGALGARRTTKWLASRRLFLPSRVSRRITRDLESLLERLDEAGLGPAAPPEARRAAIAAEADTRTAVAEITTSALVVLAGLALYGRATPGLMSLAAPVARDRAHARAVQEFPLGDWAGGIWFRVFPDAASGVEIALTGLALMLGASVVTTFAGVIADPVQVMLGLHRRRLLRMIERLDRGRPPPGIGEEQLLARLGDLGDGAAALWRWLR